MSAQGDAGDVRPRPAEAGRIAGLDVIRGIAVALVMLRHAFPSVVGFAGAAGVVLFFALSGYLITGLLRGDIAKYGRVRYGRFYRNRVLRLIPPLLALLVAFALYALVLHPWMDKLLPRDLAVALFYVSDIPHVPSDPLLGHLWTLAVEEQFYLVWPVVLLLATRLRRVNLALLLCALVILGAMFTTFALVHPLQQVYGWPSSWAIALLIGAAAQLHQERIAGMLSSTVLRRRVTLAIGLAGLLVLALLPENKANPLVYAVYGPATAAVAVLLIFAMREWRQLPTRWLVPLNALGTISYAAYLWNQPISILARSLPFPLSGIAPLVLTVVMATASWFVIERPVAAWRRALDRRQAGRDMPKAAGSQA